MHGPGRANLERSNQSAHEQSAQPEETPPQRAGKRAKTCLRAISVAAYGSEWTSRPASFSKKLDDRGKQTCAWLPGTRAHYSRGSLYCKPKPAVLAHDCGLCPIVEACHSAIRIRLASSRSSPIAGAFPAGRYPLHRNDKDTASLRTKFVSRRGFDFVLRSLPSPTAELRGK